MNNVVRVGEFMDSFGQNWSDNGKHCDAAGNIEKFQMVDGVKVWVPSELASGEEKDCNAATFDRVYFTEAKQGEE